MAYVKINDPSGHWRRILQAHGVEFEEVGVVLAPSPAGCLVDVTEAQEPQTFVDCVETGPKIPEEPRSFSISVPTPRSMRRGIYVTAG